MIVSLVVIIVLVIILYIIVGVEAAKAAVAVAHQDNQDLQEAHKYLSWATSITWISIGLIVIGFILLLIGGIFVVPEVAVVDAIAIATISMKKKSAEYEEAKKKSEKGFLGIQALNTYGGFIGVIFKLIFFGTIILITGVGVLCAIGLIYIRKSGTKTGYSNALIATILALTPLFLLILLEIINAFVVKKERKKAKEYKEEYDRELKETKKNLIEKNLEVKLAAANRPVTIVQSSATAAKPVTTATAKSV